MALVLRNNEYNDPNTFPINPQLPTLYQGLVALFPQYTDALPGQLLLEEFGAHLYKLLYLATALDKCLNTVSYFCGET